MLKYEHLKGLTFKYGSQDCYEIGRMFYRDNFGLELTPYARPEEWWKHGLNLYLDNYQKEGFELVEVRPGKVLHHYYNRLSEVVRYDTIWRRPAAVLRHKSITIEKPVQTINMMDHLPDHVRQRLNVEP
jgi:hypothetical protein